MGSLIHHSCLYECRVMHQRLAPKPHRFESSLFLFYLNLDELGILDHQLLFFKVNRLGLYTFDERDHFPLTMNPLKERVRDYLHQHGYTLGKGRVMLLTHTRVLGYVFNPVSFYYCFDDQDQPLCAIAEVGNTFREIKPYVVPLTKDQPQHPPHFGAQAIKHFYVSPFSSLTQTFDFQLDLPTDTLLCRVDDWNEQGDIILKTILTGHRLPLTNWALCRMTWLYPLITVKIILLIHWHALLLFLKGLKVHSKKAHIDLQRDYAPLKVKKGH